MTMKKVPLYILSISNTMAQSQNFAILLAEADGSRRLPVIIGMAEAQAIAIAMEGIKPPRPLTHDLFANTLKTFNIYIREVIINDLVDGTFHAKLICEQQGEVIEIDARPSDAMALALRFNCPIMTYDFILDSAGIVIQEPNEITVSEERKEEKIIQRDPYDFSSYPLEELRKILNKMVEKEDYETAAKVRDEIKRREEING